VLQEGTFERLGSSQQQKVDVRVIAATHRDLHRMITEGSFREDLYYRLNVVSLDLPSLRQRREDIVPLARHFLARFSAQHALPTPRLDEKTASELRARDWPGNVRELRNAMERAVVLASGAELAIADFPVERSRALAAGEIPFPATMREITRGATRAMLDLCAGNKSEAARRLGISRARLMRLLDAAATSDDDDLEVTDA